MIYLLLLLLSVLILVRVQLTYNMHSRALEATSAESRRVIAVEDPDENGYMVPWEVLKSHSFNLDVIDLQKWTYEQFFPDIPETKDAAS